MPPLPLSRRRSSLISPSLRSTRNDSRSCSSYPRDDRDNASRRIAPGSDSGQLSSRAPTRRASSGRVLRGIRVERSVAVLVSARTDLENRGFDRVEDLEIAGAAAEIAGEGFLDLLARRI